ncbi:transposase [Arthrobacter sp. SLBN-100]|uniref:IS110 family transposase n=1 Tax=Arthrobacter sp. SLBN-100 TaxID=2768450 RepID=UPI00116947E4|nr:IS110 family transposase [Arthrobacter sp. SLBN-100]TQJ68425.1 transposase [Arthrobacter sp. SLBN-100]
MFEHTFIGLDVHAVNVVGHALNPATGEISTHTMAADPAMVLEWIHRFEPPVKVVYESGPTGFVLARYLRAAGIDCVITASSKLLRAPGDRVKTDRRDARVLAEMLAVGLVTEVRIPDPDEEALRDLSRLRSGTAKDLVHARQHVNVILLRHGIRYPKETKEHGLWLHRQRFKEPALQFTYDADVEQAGLLAWHLARIDKQVTATAAACRYGPVIHALVSLRGIQVTTGFGLAVEIGDWTRFTGSSIGSYLGLVPARSPPANPGTRGRSPRPGTRTPENSSSKPHGSTCAPKPGPGNGCCTSSISSPRQPGSGPWKETTGFITSGNTSTNAAKCPSRPTPPSPANSPAGAGLWPPRSNKKNA